MCVLNGSWVGEGRWPLAAEIILAGYRGIWLVRKGGACCPGHLSRGGRGRGRSPRAQSGAGGQLGLLATWVASSGKAPHEK